jgi:hypothetical protein
VWKIARSTIEDAGAGVEPRQARENGPWGRFERGLEATVGIEPTMEVLQTSALPLGYVAPLLLGAEEGI